MVYCLCCQNRLLVIGCHGNRIFLYLNIEKTFILLVINFACLIALTINIEDSTHRVYDFYRVLDFCCKIMRILEEKYSLNEHS